MFYLHICSGCSVQRPEEVIGATGSGAMVVSTQALEKHYVLLTPESSPQPLRKDVLIEFSVFSVFSLFTG